MRPESVGVGRYRNDSPASNHAVAPLQGTFASPTPRMTLRSDRYYGPRFAPGFTAPARWSIPWRAAPPAGGAEPAEDEARCERDPPAHHRCQPELSGAEDRRRPGRLGSAAKIRAARQTGDHPAIAPPQARTVSPPR